MALVIFPIFLFRMNLRCRLKEKQVLFPLVNYSQKSPINKCWDCTTRIKDVAVCKYLCAIITYLAMIMSVYKTFKNCSMSTYINENTC